MEILQISSEKMGFLQRCREVQSLSENSLLAYEQDLDCFIQFRQTNNEQNFAKDEAILIYLRYLRENRGLQPSTVRRRILTLRSFYKWLFKHNQIEENPFSNLELDIKLPKRLPRPVDREVVHRILLAQKDCLGSFAPNTITGGEEKSALNQHFTTILMIKLMVTTGIRVGELTKIQLFDITDGGQKIRIRGKGNKERNVYVGNSRLIFELEQYRMARKRQSLDHEFLLVNRNCQKLTEQAVRVRLKKISKELGISPHLTPHRFRHSAATFLIEEGVDIRFVQRLLGHSSIATTEIYTRVSDSSLMAAIQLADPLEKLRC